MPQSNHIRWQDWRAQQQKADKLSAIPAKRVGGRYVSQTRGRRADLGDTVFKSRYEANYCRYLNYLGIVWQYEPKKFVFEKIKSGTRVYTPDFYLPEKDEYHETKGYMDRRSRTQIKRLGIYFPQIKLVVIDSTFFAACERQRLCRLIHGWECTHTQQRSNP